MHLAEREEWGRTRPWTTAMVERTWDRFDEADQGFVQASSVDEFLRALLLSAGMSTKYLSALEFDVKGLIAACCRDSAGGRMVRRLIINFLFDDVSLKLFYVSWPCVGPPKLWPPQFCFLSHCLKYYDEFT